LASFKNKVSFIISRLEYSNLEKGTKVSAYKFDTNYQIFLQATALEMIHEIRHAFNDLLEENDWMDVETR